MELKTAARIDVVSFDVFDTLITRYVASPVGIFHLMQSRLRVQGFPLSETQIESFAKTRIYCERVLRNESTNEDITLHQIYQKLGSALHLSDPEVSRLRRLEVDTEEECIVGVPEMIEAFHDATEKGSKLLLLSDMYLPRDVIEGFLDKVDPGILQKATLYVSSEELKTKSSGNLYRHVQKTEKISSRNWHHFGDNKFSDYLVPRKLGISATHVTPTKLKRYELIGCSDGNSVTDETPLAWQLTAGLSRARRLSIPNSHFQVGYGIAAPVLVPYVYWLLSEARKSGVGKLYFVARDGQILLAIAKQIQDLEKKNDIELHYIHGSRQSWHLPATREVGEHELTWIFQTRSFLTVENIAKRIGLGAEELVAGFRKAGNEDLDVDARLSPTQIEKLKKVLASDSPVKHKLLERAEKERKLVQQYLREQGMFDGAPFAVVDVGWTARSQDSLLSIIEPHLRPTPMQGFYFGLVHYTNRVNHNNRKHAYALTPDYSSRHHSKIYHFIHFIEVFASADHGSTMGYRTGDSDQVIPVLDNQGERVLAWGLQSFQAGVLKFVEDWHAYGLDVSPATMRRRVNDLVDYFMVKLPEAEIAEVIGAFPYSSDQEGWNQNEFGPKLSLSESLKLLRMDPAKQRHNCLWPEGSAVRSHSAARFLLHPKTRKFSELIFHPSLFFKRSARWVVRRTPKKILVYLAHKLPLGLTQKIRHKLAL